LSPFKTKVRLQAKLKKDQKSLSRPFQAFGDSFAVRTKEKCRWNSNYLNLWCFSPKENRSKKVILGFFNLFCFNLFHSSFPDVVVTPAAELSAAASASTIVAGSDFFPMLSPMALLKRSSPLSLSSSLSLAETVGGARSMTRCANEAMKQETPLFPSFLLSMPFAFRRLLLLLIHARWKHTRRGRRKTIDSERACAEQFVSIWCSSGFLVNFNGSLVSTHGVSKVLTRFCEAIYR
jgi:hypothetical protein